MLVVVILKEHLNLKWDFRVSKKLFFFFKESGNFYDIVQKQISHANKQYFMERQMKERLYATQLITQKSNKNQKWNIYYSILWLNTF